MNNIYFHIYSICYDILIIYSCSEPMRCFYILATTSGRRFRFWIGDVKVPLNTSLGAEYMESRFIKDSTGDILVDSGANRNLVNDLDLIKDSDGDNMFCYY